MTVFFRMLCVVCAFSLAGGAATAGAKPKVKVRACGTAQLVIDGESVGAAPIKSYAVKCAQARSVMTTFLAGGAASGDVKGFFCQNVYARLAPGSAKTRPTAADCTKGKHQTINALNPAGTY